MDGRKRYENDKCGRKSLWKRSNTAPFSFENGLVWTGPQPLNWSMQYSPRNGCFRWPILWVLNSLLINTGWFPFKHSGLNFRKFPVTNGTSFLEFPGEVTYSRGIPKFSVNGSIFGNSTISRFFRNFTSKCPYHLYSFFEISQFFVERKATYLFRSNKICTLAGHLIQNLICHFFRIS